MEGTWPIFDLDKPRTESGLVYLWVEIFRKKYTVVYVGKAGSTLDARCRQHLGGFKGGSTTGRAHTVRLQAGFEAGRQYAIYARPSRVTRLFGQPGISLADAEEQALIRKFLPAWNKAGLGKGRNDSPLDAAK